MCKWLRKVFSRKKKRKNNLIFPTKLNDLRFSAVGNVLEEGEDPAYIRQGYKTVRKIEPDGSITIKLVKGETDGSDTD